MVYWTLTLKIIYYMQLNRNNILYFSGVVVGLLIVVLVFIIIVRWRRRKRRQGQNRDNDFMYDDLKRANKMNNVDTHLSHNIPPSPRNHVHSPPRSPRPPPVPTRPASYTPSMADSMNTLNNFDSIHNYGSAADELENVGTLPHIEIPEFLTNLDVEKSPLALKNKPPPPMRFDEERRQGKAAQWDPNMAPNYSKGKHNTPVIFY